MPTYEYACSACGHEFEEFQSIKADPIRTCPRCGKRKVERKIGIGGAVIFRGGGFYETDYRSADYEQAKKADAAPAAGSGAETAAGSTKEQGKASSDKPGAKGSRDGAKAEGASKAPTTEGAASGASAASGGASGGSTASSSGAPNERASTAGASGSRKNHAREGRGVGNVLQLGRAKASGAKPASKPSRASPSKGAKRKGR
ncbi:MAG: zinc ribbon domain-containing protein [Bacteroidia bacterium]|nr:zinc ribbon domain-containing protein [Bacteroidia bacterium]